MDDYNWDDWTSALKRMRRRDLSYQCAYYAFIAAMLILALPKLECFNGDERFIKEKTYIALVMLVCAAFVDGSQVLGSIVICSFGRPGLQSSAAVNKVCSDMLINAKWIGRAECMYPMESIFSHRVFTYNIS